MMPTLPCTADEASSSEASSVLIILGFGHARLRSLPQKSAGTEPKVRSNTAQFCACVIFPRH